MNKDLRHNYIVNLIDGSFYGMAIGFFSFTTVLPLFVASLTDSAFLIGLVPALHTTGWLLPQLLSVSAIHKQTKYKNLLLQATLHERLPVLFMGLLAFMYPVLGRSTTLVLVFIILVWQSIGGGIAANPWQSMIAKIIPNDMRATFLGIQSSGANLLGSISAILAGVLIERFHDINLKGFGISFILSAAAMGISYFFLALTREEPHTPTRSTASKRVSIHASFSILKNDRRFFWFIVSRTISQFGMMSFAFLIVFGVKHLDMSEATAGVMTSIILITQMVSGVVMGRLADKFNRKLVMALGLIATVLSSFVAWLAVDTSWMYPVFILMGFGNGIFWTIGVAMTMDFASGPELPLYIGTANTFTTPGAVLAPLLGGWLADSFGYQATFLASWICGLFALIFLISFVKIPMKRIS